ncbi:Ras GTPase activating protein ira2 [Apophysomyces ossiformis]|uniref:Ras GTPase activating protein ira2 n=1 Tax=Apophysomyces ossiformis TaxID=679940 RepID=A0A8H7BXX7_9FUNG|nr:Ras GTPase activating protein ira2 [Apophysomyces ossiformis]
MRSNTKLIVGLINRVAVRLPVNSGRKLENLEHDPIMQQTVAAIIELSRHKLSTVANALGTVLENVSKNPVTSTFDPSVPHEVLYSQLFVLRLMSACMQHHWAWYRQHSKQRLSEAAQVADSIEAAAAAAATGAMNDMEFIHTSIADTLNAGQSIDGQSQKVANLRLIDPPPLDEALVTFLLVLLGRFLHQTHVIELAHEQFTSTTSDHQNEYTPTVGTNIDPQILDIVAEIYKATGRVLYYVSASNWSTYYSKIKNVVQALGATTDGSESSPPEIRMLECCCLTRQRLHTVLSDLSPYFLHMKREGKLLFAKTMRKAIWRWIETYPFQYAEICESDGRLLTGSEILFDMCSSTADNSRRKAILWPLQTILLSLSPDLLLQAFLDDPTSQNRRTMFLGILRKTLRSSRMSEIAAVCYVDLCKASTYVPPTEDSVLRHIAADIEDDLREKVWNFSRLSKAELANIGYTIDVQTLTTDYLLSRLRLDPKTTLTTIVPTCLEENAPLIFKLALVRSCLAIAQDDNRLPWNPTIASMYGSLCSHLRRLFLQTIRSELANTKKDSSKQNTTMLLQDLLRLFRCDPLLALLGDEKKRVEQNAAFMTGVTNLLEHNDSTIRQSASECLARFHDAENIAHWGPDDTLIINFWRISSQAAFTLAKQILDNKQDEDRIKFLLGLLLKVLAARQSFLGENRDISSEGADTRERLQASIALEIALLITLSSSKPEICSDAIRCIDYLCVESQFADEDELSQQSEITLYSNLPIYQSLASEDSLFLGRKAQQKRIRKYLRMLLKPTPGNLAAWEEGWKRWKTLTQIVSRYGEELPEEFTKLPATTRYDKGRVNTGKITTSGGQSRIEVDEEKNTEWENLTGFLVALGGCCVTDGPGYDTNADSKRTMAGDSRRTPTPSEPAAMVDRFVMEITELLISENVFVREGVKDILGNDLSPALYSSLFRHLEGIMARFFGPDGEAVCGAQSSLFVEQAILVLKLILDRLVDPNDYLLSVDFSTLINRFISYLNKLQNHYVGLRIKIRMCRLIEKVMLKKEHIIIRDETKLRNKLLEVIVEWTSDFALQNLDMNTSLAFQDAAQTEKVQRDLDQACLKAIVALLHQLPLQPSESVRETDVSQIKSKLFYKYFTFFLKLLNRCRLHEMETSNGTLTKFKDDREIVAASKAFIHHILQLSESYQDLSSLKDYTILAMSNLLSANVDAGLKYSLAMGYHEDTRTRTAFMQVLTNILNQGAEFDTLAENVVTERYEKLVDLLVGSDLEIAVSLCEVCSSTDATEVAEVVLSCFEARNKIMPLLETIIAREIASTEQEATLFRGTTTATRLLSIFAQQCCTHYIRSTLQPAIEEINGLPDDKHKWELDPDKLGSDESIATNRLNVINATEILLSAICSSPKNAPRMFRQELSLIVNAVQKRFPEAKYTAVGGFVFLRLFGPAILSPEYTGFSKNAIPKNMAVRKLLLQATRVMQNLANNVLFGAKETHMIVLNDFLTNNIYKVTSFLREISAVTPAGKPCEMSTSGQLQIGDKVHAKLHRHLADNLERISRDLAGRKMKGSNDTQTLLERKKTLDQLSNLLAQLGRPVEASQQEPLLPRNYAISNNNQFYNEFIRRNSHRDLTAISTMNIFYRGGVSRVGRPVFYMICRNVTGENFDYELLTYYMLRVMEPYLNAPFELLFDVTRFNASSEIPLQFFQLLFSEMNDCLAAFHLYNPNTHMQRHIKRLPRIITNKLVKRTHFSLSVAELHEYIAPAEVHLPKSTVEIERESSTVFASVTKITNLKMTIPVTIKIGPEHMQIITVRKQEIFWSLNTVLNDIVHMSEIDDMMALPTSRTENGGELCIKTDGGKSNWVFSTPKRDAMLSLLRYNKQRYETSRPGNLHERAVRPGDVPGRLLNMALLNIGSDDPELRLAAYNLLYSLSLTFRFDIGNQLLNARDLCIPANSADFIVGISESLAATETHLTFEFLNECFLGFNKSSDPMRQLCLSYMSPWLRNLSLFVRSVSDESNRNITKTKDILRLLIDLTVTKADMYKHIQAKVWSTLTEVDDMMNVILDSFVQYSVENGVGSTQAEAVADTIVTMSSIAARGKVISRMRRVLLRTSMRPCKNLAEHPAWTEIAVLLRIILMLSFNSVGPVKLYLPEIFHIVTLLVATGSTLIRTSVHQLVVNMIHGLCTCMPLSEENGKKLQFLLGDVCDSKNRMYFGLTKSHCNAFTISPETMTDNAEPINLSSLERITRLLLDALTIGAPSTGNRDLLTSITDNNADRLQIDVANTWRARWMGLVTSTAFQFNPAIQPRSFVVLGCLAQDEVDDDLIYQILVALRGALAIFNETDPSLIISIMMCLSNVIDNLPANSRYLKSLFWLAIALVQMNHPAIFATAVQFLQSVLRGLDAHKLFTQDSLVEVLIETRKPLLDIAEELDKVSGVSFRTHFSFAIAGILLKGLNHCEPKDIVYRCLSTFLEIDCKRSLEANFVEARTLGYLAGLMPFAAESGELRELLRLAGINDIDLDSLEFSSPYVRLFDTLEIPDNTTALLLVSLLATMINSSEKESERLFLYNFLSEAAVSIPEVFALVYDSLLPQMNHLVVKSQNYAVIDAVKAILVTACSEPSFAHTVGRRTQKEYLEELNFPALADPTFGAMKTNVAMNARLASKLLDRITE